ncbi:MAG: DNA mismatch repair protein MutS, partial [Oscillospiraceae bacterium]|nr:DNA mismatch repair protein MutS [Oscillospiraceae bacterium]
MAQTTEKISPMLQQYLDIKEKYSDYILFFRLGDFYEMFFSDAETVSRELELALTARAGSPMCGVPYHSSEIYIKRLIDKGFKVAICEQMSDPATTKGLVERDVIRLVTAGTVIEASMLSEETNNYIACVCAEPAESRAALVFADISTGEVHVFEKSGSSMEQDLICELSRFDPVELIANSGFAKLSEVHGFVRDRLKKCVCETLPDERFSDTDTGIITAQFEAEDEGALGISKLPMAKKALCAMFGYFGETQKTTVKRFISMKIHSDGEFMGINLTTRRNLELTETMRSKEKRGSLLWVLDK